MTYRRFFQVRLVICSLWDHAVSVFVEGLSLACLPLSELLGCSEVLGLHDCELCLCGRVFRVYLQ